MATSSKPRKRNTASSKHSAAKSDDSRASSTSSQQPASWKALFYFTTKSHLPILIVALISSVVSGVSSPASALLLGKAFGLFTSYGAGTITSSQFLSQETKYVSYLVAVGCASWLVQFLFFTSWVTFGELQAKSARDRLFQALMYKDVAWYENQKHGTTALVARLQVQIRELQLSTAQPLGTTISILSTACFSFGLAMYYSWNLALVTVAGVPVILAALAFLGASMQPLVARHGQKLEEATQSFTSALNSIETVKCYNGQQTEATRYSRLIQEAAKLYVSIVKTNAKQSAFMQFMGEAMYVQAFYYGSTLVDSGKKSTGDVVTTFMAALGAFTSISGILSQALVLEKGRMAGHRLRSVLDQMEAPAQERTQTGGRILAKCNGNITFQDVSFVYPARPQQLILNNINLTVRAGSLSFIIGRSGSGKSTLGQLLLRFYEPSEGKVLLDGANIRYLDAKWLRENITLVSQDGILFNDTIRQNIAFGSKDPTTAKQADIARASEFALLRLAIADMPDELETFVGPKGQLLSGGQRQRVALARAWMRDTPVLVLDESTSALDRINRSLMLDAIRAWRKGKTTIFITHDISSIEQDDFAFIIENGLLVQQGYRRNLERMKASAFRTFLPEEQRVIAPQTRSIQSSDALMSTETTVVPHNFGAAAKPGVKEAEDDPPDVKRISFLPAFLANGMTTGYRSHIPGAAYDKSPWLRFATSPPESMGAQSPTSSTASSNVTPVHNKTTPVDKRSSKRISLFRSTSRKMEDFIEIEGTRAANTRIARRGLRRPLPTSEKNITSTTTQVDDSTEKPMTLIDILRTIWPNSSRLSRLTLVLGLTMCALHAGTVPALSLVLSKLIESFGTGSAGKHHALVYSLILLAIAAFDGFCVFMMYSLLEYTAQKWADNLRYIAVRRILDQPRSWFNEDEHSGARLMETLDRHAEEMRNLLGRFVSLLTIAFVMITASLTWALVLQWKLTLAVLAAVPYVLFVTRVFGAVSGKWEKKSNDASADAALIFGESFTSIKTVRSLTLEDYLTAKYSKATLRCLQVGMQRALYSAFFFGLSDSSGMFTQALVFYVGAKLASEGVAVSKIIQVFLMLIMTITNLTIILDSIPQIGSARDSAQRFLRLTMLPTDSHEHRGTAMPSNIGSVEVKSLTFRYPGQTDQTTLSNVSFTAHQGTSTALVGHSGSGKSTIVSLLLKLYPTTPITSSTRGGILLSTRDISHIHTPTLRSRIGTVSQTPTLFAASVNDNIIYGLPPSSPYRAKSAIRAAAARAGIDDFIMSLPAGYDTMLGEGGAGVSGGQAQRITIARAIVRKPEILLLDEPTSALDVESAALIRRTLTELVRESRMTVFIVTHEREMMQIADQVVVMDGGRVAEKGTFEGLMRRGGALTRLLGSGEWMDEDGSDRENDERSREGASLDSFDFGFGGSPGCRL